MTYVVSGRSLSNTEIVLGAKGDNQVEKLDFLLPRYTSAGVDLSLGIGYAVFRLPDGETDGQAVLAPTVVDDDTVCMTLLVGEEMTAQKGRGKLCLKIAGLESAMWSSEVATTYVVSTIDMPSPQPFSMFRAMSVGSAARLADPESEQPLTVTERTINIPAELQTIAVASDENSESVSIVVPRYFDGIDLSVYDFILHTEMAGNGVDDILFNNQNGQMKSVEDSTVTLTWVLRPPQTSYEGKLSIQLYVKGESFAWHSLIGELTIAKHITGESVIPNAPSMYEQWLAEMQGLVDKITDASAVLDEFDENLPLIQESGENAKAAQAGAESAKAEAENAAASATLSQSWAVGGTGSREGEDTNNAKYYCEQAQSVTQGQLGWYATPQDLQAAHPTGQNGQWAIIGSTDTIWTWDSDTNAWVDSGAQVDLSNYYTKTQADQAFATAAQGALADSSVQTVNGISPTGGAVVVPTGAELLWKNSNPSQAFSAQTVSVPNLHSYNYILIAFSGTGVTVNPCVVLDTSISTARACVLSEHVCFIERNVTVNASDEIEFSNCVIFNAYGNAASYINNNTGIPQAIFGLC